MNYSDGFYWVREIIYQSELNPVIMRFEFRDGKAIAVSRVTGKEFLFDIDGDILKSPSPAFRLISRIPEPGEKRLLSLEESDLLVLGRYRNHGRPALNGIACPECGEELVDSSPDCELTSSPPMKDVKCPGCGWAGLRKCM